MKGTGLRLAMAAAIVLSARAGLAQNVVGGWEGDDTQGYLFLTPTAALSLSPSQSLLVRGTASFLYYGSQLDGPTDVTAPGVSAMLGYRYANRVVSTSVAGGYEGRRVRRIGAAGPGVTFERGASFAGELFTNVSTLTQINALASYGEANRYSWLRLGAKRQLTNTRFTGSRAVSLGVEATAQGNTDVTTYQLGGLYEIAWFGTRTSMQLRAGYSRSEFSSGAFQSKPYVGIGLYRGF